MSVTININNLTLCHKASGGISRATLPDVCKTPPGPIPTPYPNIAFSADLVKGTTTVKADGGNMCANYGSEFVKSTGDEPGIAGGVKSGTFIKEASWITYSFDVKLEGKGACRLTDKMFHNRQNTVNCAGIVQIMLGLSDAEFCKLCKKCQKEADAEIDWSKRMQREYQKAGADPRNKTGSDIEAAIQKSLNKQGIQTQPAGTTDSAGNIQIVPQKGPCAKLTEKATEVHERVHQKTQQSLEAKHGTGTPAFHRAWNDGKNWADDEVNAYSADENFMSVFKDECKSSCP